MALLIEYSPPCPVGHPLIPGRTIVGWKPCLCISGRTGHRLYWCELHDVAMTLLVCLRRDRTTSQNGLRF